MKLLLKHGADPKIAHRQRRHGADRGRRHRLGRRRHLRALGARRTSRRCGCCSISASIRTTPNNEGRTALMGAAHEGPQRRHPAARRSRRQARHARQAAAATPTRSASSAAGHTWQALDYAEGLVRVGVQSAVERPEAAALIRKLMAERGLPVPPVGPQHPLDLRRRALRRHAIVTNPIEADLQVRLRPRLSHPASDSSIPFCQAAVAPTAFIVNTCRPPIFASGSAIAGASA